MILQPKTAWRLLAHYGAVMIASGWLLTLSTIASSAPIAPFDEPLCYLRTQDGRVVDLQSLCSRSPIAPTQPTAATKRQPTVPSRTPTPQAIPNQVNRPVSVPDTSGSHAQGNPDSDDGRY